MTAYDANVLATKSRAVRTKGRPLTLAQAQARYPHRFTMEHIPEWSSVPIEHASLGTVYSAPQYRTDAEWYAATVFPGEGGIHGNEAHCQSTGQTWPLGKGFLMRSFRADPHQRAYV